MRVPPCIEHDEPLRDLVAAIKARRNGALLNIDRQLLHSPPLTRAWNAFFAEVRERLVLPAKLRELAICAVARLNGAEYEYFHHAPIFIEAGGTAGQLAALDNIKTALNDTVLFDDRERAVLRLSAEMTVNVDVREETFEMLRGTLDSSAEIVELVGLIAAYNMVSRIIVALHITEERERD